MKDKFTGKMFVRQWIPAAVSSIGLAFGDMADALVVGRSMGAAGLAAISLCLPIYMVINVFMHSLGLGGSAKYSKLLGEGNEDKAVGLFNNIMVMALCAGVILAALGNIFINIVMAMLGTTVSDGELFNAAKIYARIIICGIPFFFAAYILNYFLRNDNNQKLAGIGFTTANICDIAMNIIFVLVFDMGAAGAALSTVLGQIIAIVIYLPGLFKRRGALRLKPKKPDIKECAACFRNGFSTSVQYICQMIFLLIANNVLMNKAGENGVAVFDMIQNVSYMILYLYDASSKAMQPIISTYCGEHNFDGIKTALKYAFASGIAAGGAAIAFAEFCPNIICAFFGLDAGISEKIGAWALRIYGISALFAGVSIITESYYQSVSRDKAAFMLTALRGAGILIPCTIIFSFAKINSFWMLFPCTEIVTLVIFAVWKLFFYKSTETGEKIYTRTIENKNEDLSVLVDETREFCEEQHANIKQTYFVTMSVEEICLAIMQNAFIDKNGYIQVTLVSKSNGDFELHIRDNAVKFNPFALTTNKVSQHGDYDLDAIGMMVIKKKAKHFYYRQYQSFNTLILTI